MNAGDTILETRMSDDDKHHVEWLARRNGVDFLDHSFAMMIGARSKQQEILASATSFSVETASGNRGLFLDPDESHRPDTAYFIALHEMGHSVLGHHKNKDPRRDFQQEVEAWEWAVAHAYRFPDEESCEYIFDALSTYADTDEAKARPDSLLALATMPEAWTDKYTYRAFKALATKGDTNPVPLNSPAGTRYVPQPMAGLLIKYIEHQRECEKEGFMDNMRKVFSDPMVAAKVEKVAAKLGLNWDEMKKELEES